MDPEKKSIQNNTPAPQEFQRVGAEGLHDEGIDIVGSGVSEENEFSSKGDAGTAAAFEEAPVPGAASAPSSVPLPPVPAAIAPSVANVPLAQPAPIKSAAIPTAAEIIASLRQAKPPAAPVAPVEKPTLTSESAKLIASLQEMPAGFTNAQRAAAPQPMQQPAGPNAMPTYAPATTEPSLNDPSIKQLRTFKSDAEEAVRYQNVSAVDIAMAEQRKRESTSIEYEEPAKSHAGIFIVAVIAVLAILGGGWYYWFASSQGTVAGIVKQSPAAALKTIISYSKASTIVLDSDSDPLILIAAKLKQLNAGLGNIYALIPVASSTSASQIDVGYLFRSTDVPDRLARSLDKSYMVGAYTYDLQNPFMVLKDTFFQNAYAGMLEWEKEMRNDLLPLIQVAHPDETLAAGGTGSFEDAIISNIDARVLRNAAGETVLIYAFADKDTIVVTTSDAAMKFLLGKLLTVRTIQ